MSAWVLHEDRYFGPDHDQAVLAQALYQHVAGLPLVCPHGHVDPMMFADEHYSFGSPADLLIIPDHYVFRMLYSQGIAPELLGVPRLDGGWVETDHRKIWQRFADHFHLFRGTPSGLWLKHELIEIFGITKKLDHQSAQEIYDHIEAQLATPAFRPRAMFERFNIEVLSTTDAAADPLMAHQQILQSGWKGRVIPCFRPDQVVNLDAPGWREAITRLGGVVGFEITSCKALISAIESRRQYFKQMGAVATDHAALTAYTEWLSDAEAERIFQDALLGRLESKDAMRFTGYMLMQNARMSLEDGLVMQIHVGVMRNHNPLIFQRFGQDKGCDIPIQAEFTRSFKPMLEKFGNESGLTMILFNLDETTYARELAPLAGHYPAVKLGPAWWFHDSINGMMRYRQMTSETAGIYNTVGFNDDTRAFPSIPARHDLARRVDANWLAGLVISHMIDEEEASEMMHQLAYGLVKSAYKL